MALITTAALAGLALAKTASSSSTSVTTVVGSAKRKSQKWIGYVEIVDFKSYGGTHTLGPLEKGGLSCVVGPNGGGKSNLMDALCFVLGLQTKYLRGVRLVDLIYHNENSSSSPSPNPYVKLLLFNDGVAVPKTPGVVLEDGIESFCRRICDNGRTTMWVHNDKVVSQERYFQALAKLGVLPKVQNCIISQGQVESIGLKTEKELCEMFDVVSGSSQFKEPFEKCSKEIESLEADLRRLATRKVQYEAERRALKSQVDNLTQYETLKKERDAAKVNLYLYRLWINTAKANQAREQMEEAQKRIQQLQQLKQKAEEEMREFGKKKIELSREIEAKKKELRGSSQEGLKVKKKALEKLKEDLASKNGLLIQIDEQEQQIKSELVDLKSKFTAIAGSYESVLDMREALETEALASREKLKLQDLEISEEERKTLQSLDAALTTHSKKLEEAKRRRNESASEITNLKERLKEHEDRTSEIESEELEVKEKIAQLNSEAKAREAMLEQQSIENKEMELKNKRIENEISALTSESNSLETLLIETQRHHSETQKAARVKSAVLRLREVLKTDRIVRLGAACEVINSRHEVAILSALGHMADSVIVETWDVAKAAVQALKREKMPPMEFIPVSEMTESLLGEEELAVLRSSPNKWLAAIDCVEVEPWAKPAFDFALGRTLVVDDNNAGLDKARKIAFEDCKKLKISAVVVTTQGDKILKNANIQIKGSSNAGGGTSLISEKKIRETEAALNLKKTRISELQNQLHTHTSHTDTHTTEKRVLERKWANLETLLKKYREAASKMRKEITDLETRNSKGSKEIKDLEKQAKHLESSFLKGLGEKDNSSSAERLARFRSQQRALIAIEDKLNTGLSELRRQEQDLVTQLRSTAAYFENGYSASMDAAGLLSFIENELTAADNDNLPTPLRDLQLRKSELQKEAMLCEKSKITVALEVEELEVVENRRLELLGLLENQAAEISALMKTLKEELRKVDADYFATVQQVQQIDLAEFDEQGKEIIKEVALEGLALPCSQGTWEDCLALVMEATDMDTDVDLDFSSLNAKDRSSLASQEAISATHLSKTLRVEQLTKQFGEAEKPNFKSREQLEAAQMSCQVTLGEINELAKSKSRVNQELARVRKIRKTKFMECFEFVKAELGQIYAQLTAVEVDSASLESGGASSTAVELWKKHFSTSSVLGGKALLELDEGAVANSNADDEPFNQGLLLYVMPPGKRFLPIEQLSGGEKTLASVALIFALQAFRPSPFLLMDEIDAALDVHNVRSLRDFLLSTRRQRDQQLLVITHKEEIYASADSIIGIYKDSDSQSSAFLTLDLSRYVAETSSFLN